VTGNHLPSAVNVDLPRDWESTKNPDGWAPGKSFCMTAARCLIYGWWVTTLLMPHLTVAQTPPRVLPPAAKPSIRLEQLPHSVPSEAQPGALVPEKAPSRAPAGAENVRFVLNDLEIEGATAYPPEALKELYADLLGKEISLADVYDIAARIQLRYRQDGYFLTRVIVPAQTVKEGKVTIHVVEGFISDIQIEGDIGPVQQRVKSYLQNIVGDRPLKLERLERYLLLCRDIPGVNLDSVLRPAPDQPGAAQLVATVQRKPFDGMTVVDNLGSKFNGEWEVAASASSNSFTSYGERLTLTGLAGDPPNAISGDQQNQRVIQLNSSFLAGSKGLYINALGSYGDSRPGSLVSQFDFKDTQLLLSGLVGYPIIRTRDLNLTTEIGFDYNNSDTDIFNNTKFSRDRLRVLHLSGQMNFLDRWRGSNYVTFGIRKGLPIMDASDSGDDYLSVPDGTGVFTSLQASASRLQPITDTIAVFGNLGGQLALDTLLSEEQFDVGGLQYGRGYNPDELANDDGAGFTGELQYTRLPKLKYLDRYQLFGFYDYGKVWEHNGGSSDSLSSAGGGARMWLADNISVEVQVAKPLTEKSQRADQSHDPQVLFRAIGRF